MRLQNILGSKQDWRRKLLQGLLVLGEKEPIHDEEEDEANDVETEEEEEIYKSSSGESDNEEEENLEDLEYDDSDWRKTCTYVLNLNV